MAETGTTNAQNPPDPPDTNTPLKAGPFQAEMRQAHQRILQSQEAIAAQIGTLNERVQTIETGLSREPQRTGGQADGNTSEGYRIGNRQFWAIIGITGICAVLSAIILIVISTNKADKPTVEKPGTASILQSDTSSRPTSTQSARNEGLSGQSAYVSLDNGSLIWTSETPTFVLSDFEREYVRRLGYPNALKLGERIVVMSKDYKIEAKPPR